MKLRFSGSFRRFHIPLARAAVMKPEFRDRVPARFHEYRFRSIENAANAIKSVGWSSVEGLVPANFGELDLWLGDLLVVGLRIDEKRIPGGALRVRVLEAERGERRKVGSEIPPARRREIREGIESELLTRAVPSTHVLQVLWDLRIGVVLLSATSEAATAALIALFRDSFDANPELLTPSTLPLALGLPRELQKSYADARPVSYSVS